MPPPTTLHWEYQQGLADQVPDDFRFGFKVTEALTINKFPKLDRFATAFLKPCEDTRQKVGVLLLEFSRFSPTNCEDGRHFVADLDSFLGNFATNTSADSPGTVSRTSSVRLRRGRPGNAEARC